MAAAPPASDALTIEALAAASGVTVRNIRAYTTAGLLPPPQLRGCQQRRQREGLAEGFARLGLPCPMRAEHAVDRTRRKQRGSRCAVRG